jgi:hypothetical protein
MNKKSSREGRSSLNHGKPAGRILPAMSRTFVECLAMTRTVYVPPVGPKISDKSITNIPHSPQVLDRGRAHSLSRCTSNRGSQGCQGHRVHRRLAQRHAGANPRPEIFSQASTDEEVCRRGPEKRQPWQYTRVLAAARVHGICKERRIRFQAIRKGHGYIT